jgi:hypothetical protein
MQFLTLYTAATPSSGPPSPEHMARMRQFTEDMMRAGVLKATGGILSRDTGIEVSLKKGAFTVAHGAVAGSSLMPASGFAILEASSRDELVKHIQAFLEIAGDGVSEVIEIMTAAPDA